MTLGVVHEKNKHAMTMVYPYVVYEKNRHPMTLCVVHEKNKHAMTLVDPCVVCLEEQTCYATSGSMCGS